ncbi:putative protein kinase CMGC-GSK family [Helianthus annuus]|nr:putative protein kinase CMGC-GSK family [Helianthus annuus]KAJ0813419.1 putative protein kinase CMGC-GSK family [Helianthus annuus]
MSHMAERVTGQFQAKCLETREAVATRKVLKDKRYKNRELQTMRFLDHPNVVSLKHCFFSTTDDKDELYLNLVLEYVPETTYRVARQYPKANQRMTMISIKLQTYQIFKALAYIQAIGVCHRDIKPENILVNPHSHLLKLCDFETSKVLVKGETIISYICSRYHPAPELIFGATEYPIATDMSFVEDGVLAELLLGQILHKRMLPEAVNPVPRLLQCTAKMRYEAGRVIGQGSFGTVFEAKCAETGETVAIKKVLLDEEDDIRELQILQLLDHPNVVSLKDFFFSKTDKDEHLNLVLEYVPETLHHVARSYRNANQRMPMIYVKLYTYQILRALAYIHAIGVCHRDIKPKNILVNPDSHQLKLCDFGIAKVLVKGEPSTFYIGTRQYRAPELLFGATEYTTAIDIWSVGCVLAELLREQRLFPAPKDTVQHVLEVLNVLGRPTDEEVVCMNPKFKQFEHIPPIKGQPLYKIFHKWRPPKEAIDLVSRLLRYSPNLRGTALEACIHPFFDDLRDPNTRLPDGRPLPPLFNFKAHELKGASAKLVARLIPEHMLGSSGVT